MQNLLCFAMHLVIKVKEGTYTAGQIDGKWSDQIKEDFIGWLDENPDLIPMSREELDEYMENRTW